MTGPKWVSRVARITVANTVVVWSRRFAGTISFLCVMYIMAPLQNDQCGKGCWIMFWSEGAFLFCVFGQCRNHGVQSSKESL